jgi:magnesium transporter
MLEQLHVPGNAFEWYDLLDPTPEELEQFGREHRLHPNTLRDCLQPDHLPKFEEFADEVKFIILRRFSSPGDKEHHSPQDLTTKIAVFYSDKLLVTVHRKELPFLQQILDCYIEPGRADQTPEVVTKILFHTLDSFAPYVDELEQEIDNYERSVFFTQPPRDVESELYFIRRRASVLREVLELTGHVIVKMTTTPEDTSSLQDARELHTQLLAEYGRVRDDVVTLLHIHLSLGAQRTNDVMKVLTIFSAFFLPLTFIVGIYGMNFDFMPELRHPYGYYLTLAGMAAVALIIFLWFKRKGWM